MQRGVPSVVSDVGQQPGSQQLDTYTCGHRVRGAPLEVADDQLDVERRTSEETAAPPPDPD